MIFWIFITLVIFLIFISIIYLLFSSGSPRNFKDFLLEAEQVGHGTLSNFEDMTLGLCFNRISPYKQSESIAVLTGGNRGIGIEVLKKLLQCEMTVVLGVRNIEAARKSVESNIDYSLLMNRVIYEACDTGDMNSVRGFAERLQERFSGINLLINNAGIMGAPFSLTKDGFETQMAVNYIGHFLLTHLLMPQLNAGAKKSNKTSRIVNVSSCAHLAGTIKYDDFNSTNYYYTSSAYSDSKLAQIMFTRHLHKICVENNWNVQPFACHPGIVNTEIFQHAVIGSLNWLKKLIMKSPEQGARSVVYAAISPEIESKGGVYISNCRISRISKIAKNNEECKKLFEFTCNLLKINLFGRN